MNSHEANVERFNALAGDWDADPSRVLMGQKIGRAMLAALAPTGTERALEFGAGTGLVTMLLAGRLGSMLAMDSSAGMLDALRAKLERKGISSVEVREGRVPEDLPDGPFDLVLSAMTLHHVADVPALLRQLAARLVPGGRIALADLDAEDGSFHGDAAGVVHRGFERGELATWLRAAGFAEPRFSTAWTVRRETADGGPREYPVFLVVAGKPAVAG